MNVLSGDAVSADFHKEKIGQFSGGLGGKTPSGVFASFCRYELMLGQKDAAAHGMPFLQDCAFMRGQTAIPVFFRFGLRATYFLHTKKVGKDVPRGVPLEPRMVLIFRAIVGHHNGG